MSSPVNSTNNLSSIKIPRLTLPANINSYRAEFSYVSMGDVEHVPGDCFFYKRENDPTVYCRKLRIASAISFVLFMAAAGVGLYSADQNDLSLTHSKQWTPAFQIGMSLGGLFFLASIILCIASIKNRDEN